MRSTGAGKSRCSKLYGNLIGRTKAGSPQVRSIWSLGMMTDRFFLIAGGSYLCHYYVRPKRVPQEKGHRIQEKPAVAARGRLSRDTVAHLPVQ